MTDDTEALAKRLDMAANGAEHNEGTSATLLGEAAAKLRALKAEQDEAWKEGHDFAVSSEVSLQAELRARITELEGALRAIEANAILAEVNLADIAGAGASAGILSAIVDRARAALNKEAQEHRHSDSCCTYYDQGDHAHDDACCFHVQSGLRRAAATLNKAAKA